ncbi:MAG: trigger factor [Candidatus Cloacimonetes bacterium]|nr:trigger factor [Candidatus Cloacimonadota bacterium]
MQVEFNQVNAVTKEINISVPADKASKAYEKYLRKASRDIAVPGFRKGKAPLAMVERMHTDTLRDYFLKDYVDEIFEEVAHEHEIHFLLFPEVKDITWEKGEDMNIKVEVEHEPNVEFKQLEGLNIPHKPQVLEEEVQKYLESLVQDNGHIIDVETAILDDQVMVDISFKHGSESFTKTGSLFAGESMHNRSLETLVGCKTGDVIEAQLPGKTIMLVTMDASLHLEKEFSYQCSLMVNSISRMEYPAIDDEFAKDMEFDTLEQMKAKVSEDMSLKNEHININIDNYSVIAKLFVDNNFDLPHKTIEYLAEQEAEKIDNPDYKKFYVYQYRMQIAQEMVSMYIMNNLRKAVPLEVSEEMTAEYIIHEAILEDKSAEAYKEANKADLDTEEFKMAVQNYFILRQIAASSEFVIAEPEQEPEIPEAETLETTEE